MFDHKLQLRIITVSRGTCVTVIRRIYNNCVEQVVIFHWSNVFQEKPAKGRLFHTQKNLAELEERCEHPWRDLFLWAVLQNRQQMANYFWAMVSLLNLWKQTRKNVAGVSGKKMKPK